MVGILTFHASHNYGSMLQAYAIQKVLECMGVVNEIINLRTPIQKSLIPPPIQLKNIRQTLRGIIKHPIETKALMQKFHKFENFLKYDLRLTKELHNIYEVTQYVKNRGYDAIIVGSDQIWNPACWDFDMSYLLDFPGDFIRIAYAPSLGSQPEDISESTKKEYRRCLSKFDLLSTREYRGSNVINEVFPQKTVETVLDPTLLLDSNDYENLISPKRIVSKKYILYYTPRESNNRFEAAISIADKLNLPIVVTQDCAQYSYRKLIKVLNCGPREFLNLLKNAEYCIGDSFHLFTFSLIFEKPFLIISEKNDSRIDNLKSILNLNNILSNDSKGFVDKFSISNPQSHHQQISEAIRVHKQRSLSYLEEIRTIFSLNNKI